MGCRKDFVVTAAVVGGRILGIAARMSWGVEYRNPRVRNPVGTVSDAATVLWGRTSEHASDRARWDLPDGSFEATCYFPAPVFAWRTSELLAMPERARPALTLAPGNRPRLTAATVDALVSVLAEDPLWPQAVEPASQLIVDNPRRPWKSLSTIAVFVHSIAWDQGCVPDDVTVDQARQKIQQRAAPPAQSVGWSRGP
jgi:hypothetical protein